MRPLDWQKYVFVFGITGLIFGTVLYLSDFASNKRLKEIKSIEDKIAVDILSSETQFSLLAESSCGNVQGGPVLSEELNNLAEKLSFAEENLGTDNEEVVRLKRSYSLLQIKDYLLMKKISEKCKFEPLAILYFYSNQGDCQDCEKMGYVLTYLRNTYPELRVYAFDYNLDLSALKTLRSILKIRGELPAIVMNNTPYYGFHSIEELEEIIPELKKLKEKTSTSSATTSTRR